MNLTNVFSTPYRAAVVLLIDASGDVWLAKRSSTSAVLPDQWECPAGKVEIGEGFEAGALREILEETGLEVERERLIQCGIIRTRGSGTMNVACALFLVQLVEGERPQDTEPSKRSPWICGSLDWAREQDCTVGTATLLEILAVESTI